MDYIDDSVVDSDEEAEISETMDSSITVIDVVKFLRGHGIPQKYCDAFEGSKLLLLL